MKNGKVLGIVCEYNPLHNGHAHQIAEARRISGAEYVVCAMSGPFTQRGEAAVADKWSRAKMALCAGADVVVELPCLFAVRAAQDFARGGVSLLGSLGCNAISFGCEVSLQELQNCLAAEQDALPAMDEFMSQGMSHPRARQAAYASLGLSTAALENPNATLGLEYLRAIQNLGLCMEPVLVERKHAHGDLALHEMASSSAIRTAMAAQTDFSSAMPPLAHSLLQQALHSQGGIPQLPQDALFYALRRMTAQQLASLPEVSEGLEMRLFRCLQNAENAQDALMAVKCKRYPLSRLRRTFCHAYLGLDKATVQAVPLPPYARLLGWKKSARELLHRWSRSDFPIITKTADAVKTDCGGLCLSVDLRAQDLWGLCCQNGRTAGRDFTTSPAMLD